VPEIVELILTKTHLSRDFGSNLASVQLSKANWYNLSDGEKTGVDSESTEILLPPRLWWQERKLRPQGCALL